MERLKKQAKFIEEIEKLKAVTRFNRTIDGRFENSAEHSWQVAFVSNLLYEYYPQKLDMGKVTLMLLLHDLGEIYAGDTWVFDEKGKSILKHSESINVDMSDSLIIEGASTPTYVAILDEKGEMVSAIVDIDVEHHVTEEFIDSKSDVIEGSEYMFFGADNPKILEYIVKKYNKKTKFVLDPVSAAKAANIKDLLPYFHTVKPNRHEAEVLCGFKLETVEDVRRAGKYFLSLGIQNIFISLDADGVYYCTPVEEGIVKPNKVDVINVTGAGDSFMTAFAIAYLKNRKKGGIGNALEEASRFAAKVCGIKGAVGMGLPYEGEIADECGGCA